MKRILLVLLVLTSLLQITRGQNTQQNSLCGDWVYTYTSEGEDGYYSGKQYIRIICDNNRYFVRMKIEVKDKVDYYSNCVVYYADKSTIKFTIDKGDGYYTDHILELDGPVAKHTSAVCNQKSRVVTHKAETFYREDDW